jgi:hypothetical protein
MADDLVTHREAEASGDDGRPERARRVRPEQTREFVVSHHHRPHDEVGEVGREVDAANARTGFEVSAPGLAADVGHSLEDKETENVLPPLIVRTQLELEWPPVLLASARGALACVTHSAAQPSVCTSTASGVGRGRTGALCVIGARLRLFSSCVEYERPEPSRRSYDGSVESRVWCDSLRVVVNCSTPTHPHPHTPCSYRQ